MAELFSQQGKRIRIFIGEGEFWNGKPLSQALLDLAARHEVVGATIQRGIEGFGPEHHLSTDRFIETSDNLPIIVEIIDTTEHIEPLLTQLDLVVQRGTITVAPVEIFQERKEQA